MYTAIICIAVLEGITLEWESRRGEGDIAEGARETVRDGGVPSMEAENYLGA